MTSFRFPFGSVNLYLAAVGDGSLRVQRCVFCLSFLILRKQTPQVMISLDLSGESAHLVTCFLKLGAWLKLNRVSQFGHQPLFLDGMGMATYFKKTILRSIIEKITERLPPT